jgi:hypothetical protein
VPPLLAALQGRRPGEGSDGAGTPTTSEASYEPVQEPRVR